MAAKQALLAEKINARRAARPFGTRIKDLEAAIDRRKKACEKQEVAATELAKELADVQNRIQLNMQEQAKIDADMEQMEGERADL